MPGRDMTEIDARFAVLRDTIRAHGAEHAYGATIVGGVNSAKVRAFTCIMEAARAGFVFEGQALALALDWAAATGRPLARQNQPPAASKVAVWIKAGRSNAACGTVRAMAELVGNSRIKGERFFEKCCTGLRRALAEGQPLTEREMVSILSGERERECDPLRELAAALKRAAAGYGAACEAMPGDGRLTLLHVQAMELHAKAEEELKARGNVVPMRGAA